MGPVYKDGWLVVRLACFIAWAAFLMLRVEIFLQRIPTSFASFGACELRNLAQEEDRFTKHSSDPMPDLLRDGSNRRLSSADLRNCLRCPADLTVDECQRLKVHV